MTDRQVLLLRGEIARHRAMGLIDRDRETEHMEVADALAAALVAQEQDTAILHRSPDARERRVVRMRERVIDWGFRALIVLNALLLLGTVGSMELGRLGILRGAVLCVGYMVVIAACVKWGRMNGR